MAEVRAARPVPPVRGARTGCAASRLRAGRAACCWLASCLHRHPCASCRPSAPRCRRLRLFVPPRWHSRRLPAEHGQAGRIHCPDYGSSVPPWEDLRRRLMRSRSGRPASPTGPPAKRRRSPSPRSPNPPDPLRRNLSHEPGQAWVPPAAPVSGAGDVRPSIGTVANRASASAASTANSPSTASRFGTADDTFAAPVPYPSAPAADQQGRRRKSCRTR